MVFQLLRLWAICCIGILLTAFSFFALRLSLEQLIIRNYTFRLEGIAQDKVYWADKMYMNIFGKSKEGQEFYRSAMLRSIARVHLLDTK